MTNAEKQELLTRLSCNDVEDIQQALVELTLRGCSDPECEGLCIDHSKHYDEGIRGNAVLGLGHLATN